MKEYQPSSSGGTRSPPATPHCLQNPKWPPGGPKMTNGVLKGIYPKFLGVLKGHDVEKNGGEKIEKRNGKEPRL